MLPHEHYETAERLLASCVAAEDGEDLYYGDGELEDRTAVDHALAAAQVHATLALAGFTRAANLDHVHNVSVTPTLGGTPIQATTAVGRPV